MPPELCETCTLQVEYLFDGGTPCDIEALDEKTTRCAPFAHCSGSQWFYFCVRVTGLPSQGGRLLVQWPDVLTATDMPPGKSEEDVRRQTQHDSFATVLPRTCVLSRDLTHWTPAESVEVTATGEVAIPLPGGEAPIYVATQHPYRWADWQSLLAHVQATEPTCVRRIGHSRAGLPMYAFTLSALEPADDQPVPTVYMQAFQHATEFTGPLVVDAMVRHLLTEEGRELRRHTAFDFVPLLDVDRLHSGIIGDLGRVMIDAPRGNSNRDWCETTWPEIRNVQAFLQQQINLGKLYQLGLDLHNGWSRADRSAACYSVFDEEETSPQYVDRQKAFIDHMYARTDHTEPGRYWRHRGSGRFVDYFYSLTGAIMHTVEFSRHHWWSRVEQRHVRPTAEHPRRFGVDALHAILSAPLW